MDTKERAPARPALTAVHPNVHATLWAVAAYPVGALAWACVGAGAAAADAETTGFLGGLGWFGWSLLWLLIICVAAAPFGLALATVETFAWRLAVIRFRMLDQHRLGLVLGSALLALPWAFLVPWVAADWLQGPWPPVVAFACAWLGFLLPRLLLPPLRTGALVPRRHHPDSG